MSTLALMPLLSPRLRRSVKMAVIPYLGCSLLALLGAEN